MEPVQLGHIAAGSGPTLVALHGGLLSGRLTFGLVLGDWARRFRVLVPDRRGFEHTPTAGAATIAEQARDLEAFIDEHAGGRAHVVGFSFGGVVALTALQLERRLFASLTVVEAPAVTLCGRDPEALALRMRLADLYDRAVGGDGRDVARDFFSYMDPRALGRIEALLAAGDPGLHVVLDELRIWRTPLSPAGLAGVQVPVLAVTGQRSPTAMHRIGDLVADATGGTHHVQHAAGHAAHLVGRPWRAGRCAPRAPPEPVMVVPHDPDWTARYENERAAIADVLGDDVVAIAHIGGTAVPGLPAKPVIDLMVGVDGSASTLAVGRRLRAAGYAVRDDPASANDGVHVFGVRGVDGRRLAHAHVVTHGDRWWRDHIAFRDRLRADADLRARYTQLKERLAMEHRRDRDAYTDAKTEFVTTALADERTPR
jgi:GrpB-like predicted nucleotidyltransferase (UPF0157 family)/pimeloyl-ACP methyl ester carboxylesterase